MKILSILLVLVGIAAAPSLSIAADVTTSAKELAPSSPGWHRVVTLHQQANTTAPRHQVLLLGDSITARWPAGLHPEKDTINRGIGGDRIGGWKYYGILDRLDSAVDALQPRKIYLMIGINDLLPGGAPMENLVESYARLLDELAKRVPPGQVIVQSILPVRGQHEALNGPVVELNRHIQTVAETRRMPYLNLHPLYLDPTGRMNPELTSDGVHLNEAGYKVWAQALQQK